MKKSHLLSALLILIFSACGGGDDMVEIPEAGNNPVSAILVFPEKNSECNEGEILNETQSKVTFRWKASEFTDSYEVNLRNLTSQISSTYESTTNAVAITLERGTAYKWFVVSKSAKSVDTAKSESWQFYNAAPRVENYAPFPAEVVSPINGSTVTATSGKVTLSWEGSDLDNDISEYEVYYGTDNPPTIKSGVLTANTFAVQVTLNSTFYWMVKTIDQESNTSKSDVFSFIVQ